MKFIQNNNKLNLNFFKENLLNEYESYIENKKTLSVEVDQDDFDRLMEMYIQYANDENKDLFFELANNEENRDFFRKNINYYDTIFSNCKIKFECKKDELDQLNKLYKDTQKQK